MIFAAWSVGSCAPSPTLPESKQPSFNLPAHLLSAPDSLGEIKQATTDDVVEPLLLRRWSRRAISEGLRQEAGEKLRVTVVMPGFTKTNFADSTSQPELKAQITAAMDKMAISAEAIARAMAFAIEQPADVDVSEIIVRPTAQG